jgi:hypothetical protein
MKRFKVIKNKLCGYVFLSKGCRVSRIISCVVEDLDSGELMKIKSSTISDLEKTIINKIDDFDLECGDVFTIRE